MSSHYKHEDDDARSSITVSSSAEAHPKSPLNPSLQEENVPDEGSIEKHDDDDIDPPLSKSPAPTLTLANPAAAPGLDPYLVTWDGPNDPENPQNWSFRRKCINTAAIGLMTLCVYVATTSFVAIR
jgi:MFS transporter, DHA1 family, multidrug resistance protein